MLGDQLGLGTAGGQHFGETHVQRCFSISVELDPHQLGDARACELEHASALERDRGQQPSSDQLARSHFELRDTELEHRAGEIVGQPIRSHGRERQHGRRIGSQRTNVAKHLVVGRL